MMKQLVKKYHSQQYRNGKIPYTDHLFGVKSILMSALSQTGECKDLQLTEDMCNAALGHDLLEDTDVSEAEVISVTNERVLELIQELTNPVDDSHTEQYMQQLSIASEEARLIKYADLIENTTSVAYSYYTLGEQWLQGFYAPILHRSKEVLAKTVFLTYPQTAEVMRNLLAVVLDLLEAKRRNALNGE